MTPSAKRAKAKLLIEWIVDRILKKFPEYDSTHVSAPATSAHGEDVTISDEFRRIFPYSIEGKNQKGYSHVYADMDQTVKNCKGHTPVLVVKSPYKEPLVILRWADWEKTLGE